MHKSPDSCSQAYPFEKISNNRKEEEKKCCPPPILIAFCPLLAQETHWYLGGFHFSWHRLPYCSEVNK